MFPAPWTEIWPAGAKQDVGTPVLMIARVFGLWWVNACRIVYHLDGHHASQRCGFAYGTLPGHVEQGEERFMVEWDHEDNVWYDVRAFSRPRYWLVRLGYPIARRLQRRFVLQSQAAMRRMVVHTAQPGRAGMKTAAETRSMVRAIARGFVAIVVGVTVFLPPFDGSWTARILILAACVVVPLGLKVISLERLGTGIDRLGRIVQIVQFLGAWLLAYALLQPQGWSAALLRRALPGCNGRRCCSGGYCGPGNIAAAPWATSASTRD